MEEKAIAGANQETLAIVFGDLVGLDLLTAQLGDLQTNSLRQQFFQQTGKLIERHEGELVKAVGDGFLAVFPRTEQAVEVAFEIEHSLQNGSLHVQSLQLSSRFGIHYASVTAKRTDGALEISGPELTYAARLLGERQSNPFALSEAAEGSIPAALSERLRDEIVRSKDHYERERIPELLKDAEQLIGEDRWDLASKKADEVVRIDPQNAKARELTRRANRPKRLDAEEENIQACQREVQNYLSDGRYDQAILVMEELLSRRPGNVEFQSQLEEINSKRRNQNQKEAKTAEALSILDTGDRTGEFHPYDELLAPDPTDQRPHQEYLGKEKDLELPNSKSAQGFLDEIVTHGRFATDSSPAPAPLHVPPMPRPPVLRVTPSQKIERPGTLRRFLPSLFGGPRKPADSSEKARQSLPESSPPAPPSPAVPLPAGAGFTGLPEAADPRDATESFTGPSLASPRYTPPSSACPPGGGGFTQLLRALDAPQQSTPQPPTESSSTSLPALPSQSAGSGGLTRLIDASVLRENLNQSVPPEKTPAMPHRSPRQSTQHKLGRVRAPRVHITYDVEVGNAVEMKELPFVMGILGDLTGQPEKPLAEFRDRKFVEINSDNFDTVLREMQPHLAYSVKNTLSDDPNAGQTQVDLHFAGVEASSPEQVAKQVKPLRELLDLRTRLSNLHQSLQGNAKLDEMLFKAVSSTEARKKLKSELGNDGDPDPSPPSQLTLGQGDFTRLLSSPATDPDSLDREAPKGQVSKEDAVKGNLTSTLGGSPAKNPPPLFSTQPFFLDLSSIECASEAIVVIDIVQATATSDLFGWYAVGRVLIRELREYVRQIGAKYDMCCIKSTGDGFLLTYRNEYSAEVAAIHAVKASRDLLTQLAIRNQMSPEQRKIAVRLALHFGEVDILPDDRQGPNISYAFRVEAISRASLLDAINAIDPDRFPLRDYIICSERVNEIVERHLPDWPRTSCGLFKLKGFTGWGELFLISERADV